ncbi:hypothetical protein HX049_04460 [Myroides odoratimimus]|uniref:hypothetical protein n=1 Tax=Myroides odoratimimus TaxID=76832 RepID=UPI0025771570|nr:hypothetical protein [Myroides odoratimimus]MDM1396430.1 hypothetical protein [Myroides odoratimimus]
MEFNNSLDQKELITVPVETRFHLEKASSYAKIVGIIGMIISGLFALVALALIFGGTSIASFVPGGGVLGLIGGAAIIFIGLFCLLLFCAMIFLMLKVYKFSTLTASSIMKESDEELELGLKELKTYFMGTGILIIALIFIFIVGLISFGSVLLSLVSSFGRM